MPDRTCPVCAADVIGPPSKVYCSDRCGKRAYDRRRYLKNRVPRPRGRCKHCDGQVEPPRTLYCSDECSTAAADRRRIASGHGLHHAVRPVACIRCESSLRDYPSTKKIRFYCKSCTSYNAKGAAERKALWRRNWAQKTGSVVVDRTIDCVTCGKSFTTSQPRAEACSRYCNQRSPKAQARKAARRGAGVVGPPFTNAEIAERDGWCCNLCGKRISRTAKWPDGPSLSVDHIVPISEGGEHLRSNVQATHLRCNLSKGTRAVGEQLRLVG